MFGRRLHAHFLRAYGDCDTTAAFPSIRVDPSLDYIVLYRGFVRYADEVYVGGDPVRHAGIGCCGAEGRFRAGKKE